MNLRPIADRTAIALSALCVVHCLLLPVAIAMLPALAALGLDNEAFHGWMVVVVLPVSAIALVMGCRRHGRPGMLALGSMGLVILILAVVAGHEVLGETGERLTTVLGALLIAFSHYRNFILCQRAERCECPE
jgi:hypothetical protein